MGIDKRAIAKLAQEIEDEFAKHPVKVPLKADASGVTIPTQNYYGPVVQVHGDHAQLAWDNQSVTQNQSNTQEIAPGYEALAEAMVRTLQSVEAFGIPEPDSETVRTTVTEVLAEVTKPTPERSIIERGVNVIKGVLSGVALGMTAGVTEESKALATHVIGEIASAM